MSIKKPYSALLQKLKSLISGVEHIANSFPKIFGVSIFYIVLTFIVIGGVALGLSSRQTSEDPNASGQLASQSKTPTNMSGTSAVGSSVSITSSKSSKSSSGSSTHGSTQSNPSGATQPSCSSADAKVSDPTAPHGIYVFGGEYPNLTQPEILKYLLPNPDICGATLTFDWAKIDNGPSSSSRYDWSYIQSFMSPWEAAGKTVNLVFVGSQEGTGTAEATPSYVTNQVQMIDCSGLAPAPVFWQPGYEDNWKTFIAAADKEFSSDSHVGYMRFAIGTGGESVNAGAGFPSDPHTSCASQWDAAGYQTQWPIYFQSMVDYFGSLHSPKQLDIGLNDLNDIPNLSTEAQWAVANNLGFGEEGLRSTDAQEIISGQSCSVGFNYCGIFDQFAGKVPLHEQDYAATTPSSGDASVGLLPPLLQASLDIHVQIFEAYEQDLLIAFDPSYPGYNQYHASYAQAIAATAAVVGTFGGVSPVGNN